MRFFVFCFLSFVGGGSRKGGKKKGGRRLMVGVCLERGEGETEGGKTERKGQFGNRYQLIRAIRCLIPRMLSYYSLLGRR